MPRSSRKIKTAAGFSYAGIETTSLGFGCASLMRLTSSKARHELLQAAFENGIRHYDVARMYGLGAAEGEVGRFANGRRDQITIATKFGIEPNTGLGGLARFQRPARALLNNVPAARRAIKRRGEAFNAPRRYDAEIARRSFDKSLQELNVDYVDFLFLHDPSPQDDVQAAELVSFFEEVKAAGKIRAWGVSQDAHPGLDLIGDLGPSAVLQIRESILTRSRSASPRITFGVLGSPLEQISSLLANDSQLKREWSAELDLDLDLADALPSLLFADARVANPNGMVLFSTTRPERIPIAVEANTASQLHETLEKLRVLVGRAQDQLDIDS